MNFYVYPVLVEAKVAIVYRHKRRKFKKTYLVPVFASEYSAAEVLNATDEQLRRRARAMSTPIEIEISLDGKALHSFYVESEPFYITVPSNHSLENAELRQVHIGPYRADTGTY